MKVSPIEAARRGAKRAEAALTLVRARRYYKGRPAYVCDDRPRAPRKFAEARMGRIYALEAKVNRLTHACNVLVNRSLPGTVLFKVSPHCPFIVADISQIEKRLAALSTPFGRKRKSSDGLAPGRMAAFLTPVQQGKTYYTGSNVTINGVPLPSAALTESKEHTHARQ